ncbi:hypothetical protein [Blastococcus xanthinilyticus]|uniref:Uncharacterized protein n=1 Tax=Blastococcus xanthinilyticus TaxID=1564164 RepID=A0A5S5CP09_9ACTN|nr:hypothetical protein [Blastococcus xanthinilyticus]TYP81256.1 hypothetical protein BD833_12410 [Blastococcus xanthinilyticus]
MSAHRNSLDTLSALRPRTSVTAAWPPAVRDAALERVLLDRGTPAAPVRSRFRLRRLAVGGLATGAVLTGGLGVAAGAGVLPQDFVDTFAFWAEDSGVDLSTAERNATAPGPDGLLFSVVTMSGPDGTVCVAPLFETPESASGPVPSVFEDGGGSCGPEPSTEAFGSNAAVNADDEAHIYWVPAGRAVRAELTLPDGSGYPAVLVHGGFHGWFPTASEGDPVLTGYAADGSVVGQVGIPRLR